MTARPKILIVDDIPQNLFALERLLKKMDVEIYQARSGAEALALALDHDLCLAIVDVQMPEMDGYELVDLLRGNESTAMLPIIFVSAVYSDEYHHRKGYEVGAVDFLSKPYPPEILLSKVKVFIDLYHQRERLQILIDKLDAAYLQLGVVNKELERFAISVAEQLRTPLRTLDGYSRILQEDYGESIGGDAQTCLRNVRSSAERMNHIIDALLSFSRLGDTPLSQINIDMTQLVRDVIQECLCEYPDSNVEIDLQELPNALADYELVRIALSNLVSNALKFSKHQPDPKIEIGYKMDGNLPVYFVADNGCGFDMQLADRLFGVFQRLHTPEHNFGVGIGLANARRIINRHGGEIWAHGEVDHGAIFYFTLTGKNAEPM